MKTILPTEVKQKLEDVIETYKEMNARHTAEFNALPLGFAFSKDQFKRVLEQWNITEEEAEEKILEGFLGE